MSHHEPLYLKYRPQCLNDLVGQAAVTRTLANAISSGRISHAYLFTGPRGTGKTSSARILAKSLNCEHGPTSEPCLNCTPCREIKTGTSPAVFEIDAASNNSVDDARVLIERAPLVAVGGRYKLYIIDECHMLTKEAFNALLKTIEEPPPSVIFILATTEEHKVPPTIVSRCQRLMFRLSNQSDLVAHLRKIAQKEEIEIAEEALEVITRRSGGSLRDALGLLDQSSLLAAPGVSVTVSDLLGLLGALSEDVLLEISSHIQDRQGDQVLSVINRLLLEGREPSVISLELARHFLSLVKASYLCGGKCDASQAASMIIGSPEYISGLLKQAVLFDRGELSQIVEQLGRLEQTCRRTTQPALNLEMGLLSICHRHDIVIVRELEERVSQLEFAMSTGSLPAAPAPRAPASPGSIKQAPSVVPQKALSQTTIAPHVAASDTSDRRDPEGGGKDALVSDSTPITVLHGSKRAPRTIESPARSAQESAEQTGAAAAELSIDDDLPTAPVSPQQNETAGKSEGEVDLDFFWSQILEQLKKINIPAYSVLVEHAFPVSLSKKEFTVGVLTEHFQDMVERRLEKTSQACEAVLGYSMLVRVKVVSDTSLKSPRSGSTLSESSVQKRPETLSFSDKQVTVSAPLPACDHGQGKAVKPAGKNVPASETGAGNLPERLLSAPAGATDIKRADFDNDPSAAETEEGGPRVVSGRAVMSALTDRDKGFDSQTVRDAYKIFEGPGSRLIC